MEWTKICKTKSLRKQDYVTFLYKAGHFKKNWFKFKACVTKKKGDEGMSLVLVSFGSHLNDFFEFLADYLWCICPYN